MPGRQSRVAGPHGQREAGNTCTGLLALVARYPLFGVSWTRATGITDMWRKTLAFGGLLGTLLIPGCVPTLCGCTPPVPLAILAVEGPTLGLSGLLVPSFQGSSPQPCASATGRVSPEWK